MTRSRFGRRTGQPRSAEELQWLARGLAESGGRAEDVFWEQSLSAAVDKLLESGDEDAINASLDQLFKDNLPGYEALADILESRAESTTALGSSRKPAAADHDIVLIAAPILAWSRFAIPANHLPESLIANLRVHLGAHVLADGVKFAFADALFSPDQLPQGYCETALFTRELGSHAQSQQDLNIDADTLPETTRFLSDLRYILAAVSVKRGAPIFRWQEADGSREHAATQWAQQAGPCIAPMLAGCSIEMVLPEAFFAASRHADHASRPYSIRASVAFLCSTLEITPADLSAVVAPFCQDEIEEYRISFTVKADKTVVHGVVWPLLGAEEEADMPAQIDTALQECGIKKILHLDSQFPMEYCDDCGVPMYPSADGEAVHADLPEDKAEQAPRHLH